MNKTSALILGLSLLGKAGLGIASTELKDEVEGLSKVIAIQMTQLEKYRQALFARNGVIKCPP